MKILLDTDIVSYLMRDRSPGLKHRMRTFGAGDVAMSAISLAELSFGTHRGNSGNNRQVLDRFAALLVVAPFDAAAATVYGEIRTLLERNGTPIGPLDTLIAAHAISLNVPLATNNLREFRRVPGLRVENWLA
ncbi:MAG: type II toxin-antitoxin system VapC family toxin [Reyranellales bacterium]